jgi:hypothetical protein
MNDKTKRRSLGLALALFLFSIYLLTYRGGFHSVDEVSIFAVTESLVKFGQVNTNQIAWTQWTTSQAEAQGFFGADGQVYSKKGLALSLAQAPLYGLALLTPGLGMLQTVSLLNAFVTAATGLLVLMFLDRLGFRPSTSLVTALIYGLATIAWVYAKYLFSEPLAGLLLLLAAYMLFTFRREGGLRHLFIAGLAAGFAVLTRANNLFLLPVFGLYLLWILFDSSRRGSTRPMTMSNEQLTMNNEQPSSLPAFQTTISNQQPSNPPVLQPSSPPIFQPSILPAFLFPLLTFAAALTIPGLLLLIYNAARSGHPWQTGYDLTLFSPNLLLGLYKLLFSPLRGLFVYTPLLLLSLPGWWRLRRRYPAESWLFAGLAGVTVILFSAWSSGEGLSWGSRFLVPVVPFLTLCLAPLVDNDLLPLNDDQTLFIRYLKRLTFLVLLSLSLFIQFLGVTINPWVYLSQIQAEFGGEFFLENTAALYDFRYSQIAGQLLNFAVEHSDLAWWQPEGVDGLAFGVGLAFTVLAAGWLWIHLNGPGARRSPPRGVRGVTAYFLKADKSGLQRQLPLPLRSSASLLSLMALLVPYTLLARYYHTDPQFGPVDDAYTRALQTAAAASPGRSILTVAQHHYHLPMNRFKERLPLIGFAQQRWPPPDTAWPLLTAASLSPDQWLVTVGFPPAAPDNAAERWLALNAFKVSDEWLPDDVRLVHFTAAQPASRRPLEVTLGNAFRLADITLPTAIEPGRPLPVEFRWQALASSAVDYTVFLQLLNPDGGLVAQQDSSPNGGYSPTTGWTPGQTVISRHALGLPADLPPGDYRLITGLYNPATGQRLATGEGTDFVELGRVSVHSKRLSVISGLNPHPSSPTGESKAAEN